jgi:hypothetical protein
MRKALALLLHDLADKLDPSSDRFNFVWTTMKEHAVQLARDEFPPAELATRSLYWAAIQAVAKSTSGIAA